MGWEAGKASKLKSSKSSASGTGWLVVADGGGAKASIHHESQSNDGVGSGKGSETVCFRGAQSKPRGFLTVGSPESNSDNRLFRECGGEGGETSWAGVGGRESEWEVDSGERDLNETTKHELIYCKMKNTTHKRRLRNRNGVGWGSDDSSEQDRFRFREGCEASSSLSSDSVECVSEGVADELREGGDEYKALPTARGGDGV